MEADNQTLVRWLVETQGIDPGFPNNHSYLADLKDYMLANYPVYESDEFKLISGIGEDYRQLILTTEEYYCNFLLNHVTVPLADILQAPLTKIFPKVVISLIAEYAIPIGLCCQFSYLSNPMDLEMVKFLHNESKLRGKLVMTAEKEAQSITDKLVSFWGSSSIEKSSLILARSALPCEPKKLTKVVNELKTLNHSVPHFKNVNSAKAYLKKILVDGKDIIFKQLDKIQTLNELYDWALSKGEGLFTRNSDLKHRSPANEIIHTTKMTNLANFINQLKRQLWPERWRENVKNY